MDNELKNAENTETNTNQNGGNDTVDLKELQNRVRSLEAENGKLKQSVTNASADASKWKKQYQDKLSDEEKTKQQQDEATAAMQSELEQLRKERNIAKISGALVANDIGMDADMATTVATAMNAGETDKVLDGIRQFIKAHDKSLRESALKNNPTLQSGSVTKTITQEDFDRMSYKEMVALKAEHPEQFAEFINKH